MKLTPFSAPLSTFGFVLGAAALTCVACGEEAGPVTSNSEPFLSADTTSGSDTPDRSVQDDADAPDDEIELEIEPCDDTSEEAALVCRAAAMVGDWFGMATRGDDPGYGVEATFFDDGTYELRCPLFGESGPDLCLEEDLTETPRAFMLTAVAGDGSASGRIEVPSVESLSYVTDLRLSADRQRLQFSVWSPWDGREVAPTRVSLNRFR